MIEKTNIEKTNAWPFVEAKKILKERKKFIEELMKEESNSSNINCIIIGRIIDTPSMICKIPSIKKTVL